MKYFNLIIALLCITNLAAQYSESENTIMFNYDIDYEVQFDTSLAVNSDHVYSEYLSTQDDEYVQWVYQLNEQRNKSIRSQEGKSSIVSDKEEKNSLIFTLVKNGEVRYDTVSNLVEINLGKKPNKIGFFRKLWNKIRMPNVGNILDEQNLVGSLPKGCMSWVNANDRRLKCGVEIIQPSSDVTMVLFNDKGSVVHTFADETLYRGWNNYRWNRGDHKKGIYTLKITVDGESLSQDVKIK